MSEGDERLKEIAEDEMKTARRLHVQVRYDTDAAFHAACVVVGHTGWRDEDGVYHEGPTLGTALKVAELFDAIGFDGIVTSLTELQEKLTLAEASRDQWKRRTGNGGEESVRFGPLKAEPWEGNGPCDDCAGRSPYWHAPDDLWQKVMSEPGKDPHDPGGVICPVCFVIRAWKKELPEFASWWTWTPIPTGFLPEGDFHWAIDRRDEALEERDALASRLSAAEAVIEAAEGLAEKLDECDPHVTAAYSFMQIHGGQYNGPEYGTAKTKLRAALTTYRTTVPRSSEGETDG